MQHRHVREVIRTNLFSYSTEKTYIGWLYRLIIFQYQRHPKDIDFELDEISIRGGTVFHRWFTPALKFRETIFYFIDLEGVQVRIGPSH